MYFDASWNFDFLHNPAIKFPSETLCAKLLCTVEIWPLKHCSAVSGLGKPWNCPQSFPFLHGWHLNHQVCSLFHKWSPDHFLRSVKLLRIPRPHGDIGFFLAGLRHCIWYFTMCSLVPPEVPWPPFFLHQDNLWFLEYTRLSLNLSVPCCHAENTLTLNVQMETAR